jgi:hypothetical protein
MSFPQRRSRHYILKLSIMDVSFPHRGRLSRRHFLKLSIMDVSFPHKGKTISSLCPKAVDHGCVLLHSGAMIPSLCPKAADHGCVLPPQGDVDPVATSECCRSRMCPSLTGGRQSHRYFSMLPTMDTSFLHRGTTIPSLCPKVADRGCIFLPHGDDDPVATFECCQSWMCPSLTGETISSLLLDAADRGYVPPP